MEEKERGGYGKWTKEGGKKEETEHRVREGREYVIMEEEKE